jgi:hypothetical protein
MSEIVLPPLTPNEIAARDYQENILDLRLRECWHGNNFDSERAEKLTQAYSIEIFNTICNFYRVKVGYRAEWLPEIVHEAVFRGLMTYKGHREQGLDQITDMARSAVMHHLRTTSTSERARAEFHQAFSATTPDPQPDDTLLSESTKSQADALLRPETIINRRLALLNDYKQATRANDYRIYTAQNSNIHKPEFYQWKNGKLPDESKTTKKFEAFLKSKKRPIRRNPTH